MIGILTSKFKTGTGDCAGWSASPGFPGCSRHSGVYPIIFALYSNDLLFEALSLTSISSSSFL